MAVTERAPPQVDLSINDSKGLKWIYQLNGLKDDFRYKFVFL